MLDTSMLNSNSSSAFEAKKLKVIRSLVDNHIKMVEALEQHKQSDCLSGNHLMDGFATGGSSGHYISHCKLCDYKEEGWD